MNGSEIWNELGNIYFKVGAWNEAVNAYSRAIELIGDDLEKAVSWNRLGCAYRESNDYEKALFAFQRAVELNPGSEALRVDLSELHSRLVQVEAEPIPVESPSQDDLQTVAQIVEAPASDDAAFAVAVDEAMPVGNLMVEPPVETVPEAVQAEALPAPRETAAVIEAEAPASTIEASFGTPVPVPDGSQDSLADTQPTGGLPAPEAVIDEPAVPEAIVIPEVMFTALEPTPEVVPFVAQMSAAPAEAVDESAVIEEVTEAEIETPALDFLRPEYAAFGGQPSEVALEQIERNPRQPRAQVEVGELLDSVREHGIILPLIVTLAEAVGRYVLVAGERRLEAARQAGLTTVPVIVREASDQQRLELALIENVQRSDLNALELAEAYRQLADEFELSHEAIAARVGKSRAAVTNTLRLLKLSPAVKAALVARQIGEGHARALLRLATDQLQEALLEYVLKNELSVRKVEELVRELKGEMSVDEILGTEPAVEVAAAPAAEERQVTPVESAAVEMQAAPLGEVTVTMAPVAQDVPEPDHDSPLPPLAPPGRAGVHIGELDDESNEDVPDFNVIELDPPEWWQASAEQPAVEEPAAAPMEVVAAASSEWVPEEYARAAEDFQVSSFAQAAPATEQVDAAPALQPELFAETPAEAPLEASAPAMAGIPAEESPVVGCLPEKNLLDELAELAEAGVKQEELEALIEATISAADPAAGLVTSAPEPGPTSEMMIEAAAESFATIEAAPEVVSTVMIETTAAIVVELPVEEAPVTTQQEDVRIPEAVAMVDHSAEIQNDTFYVDSAIAAYRKVTEINPNNDRAWDALGNFCSTLGRFNDAVAAFEKAISLDPDREVYHYHLGLVHAAEQRFDDAISAFHRAIELNPEYTFAHCALAGHYRRLGREDQAQKHISIALPKMRAEKEYNRACFEAICGNHDQAIELLKVALDKKQTPIDWVCRDPDLESIREDPRFRALVARSGVKAGATVRGRTQPWWLTATAP